MASEWEFKEYGTLLVLEQGSHGLDVTGEHLCIDLEEPSEHTPQHVAAHVPLAKLCELLSRHPSGLAAMATALRAAGWTVAEPGAPEVLLDQDGDCLSPVRYVRSEVPR